MLPKSNYKRVLVNGKIERVWIGEGPEPTKDVDERLKPGQVTKESIDKYFEEFNGKLMNRLREINNNGVEKIDRDMKNINRKHFAR